MNPKFKLWYEHVAIVVVGLFVTVLFYYLFFI